MSILKNKVLILFSGGIDSTATAVYYLQEGYKVKLTTFDNGAEKGLDRPKHRANLLRKQFAKLCSWQLLDSRELFHRIAIKNLEKDVQKYGNLICLGCKLAMLSEAIIYCKRHGIKIIADGFNKEQSYYPEQTPEYITVANSLSREFDIKYEHPIYDRSHAQIEKLIFPIGITTEPMQVDCLFGFNRVKNKNIRKYTQSKLSIVRKYIIKFSS